jgi:hypothetical protein
MFGTEYCHVESRTARLGLEPLVQPLWWSRLDNRLYMAVIIIFQSYCVVVVIICILHLVYE